MENALLIVQLVLGVLVAITIYMQPSKSDALSGLVQGANQESFFSKNKSRTKEVILVRLTVLFSALFAANALILNSI